MKDTWLDEKDKQMFEENRTRWINKGSKNLRNFIIKNKSLKKAIYSLATKTKTRKKKFRVVVEELTNKLPLGKIRA